MTTAVAHARTLLAAIIPDRPDLLDRALRDLTPQQIPDRILANLLHLLERYLQITGAVITRQALEDLLSTTKADAGTIAAYQETYDELVQLQADEAMFRWSLEQIRELAADRATREALTLGMEVLNRGAEDEDGKQLKGHADARAYVLGKFADIDRSLAMQEAPEGDIRREGAEVLKEYEEQEQARSEGRGSGISFGVAPLDDRVDGLHNGELVLIVGYTSDGKTSMCVQLAWSAAVEQCKNVLFLTTETVRQQVRRKLISRHSCLPMFGSGDGLNSRDIKFGSLSDDEKRHLVHAVQDLDTNTDYGKLYVAQVPRGASMSYVESKALRVGRDMHIDLVIMDYLALLKPDRKRTTVREELSETLKAAKQLSTTINDGKGVPFVSPWQVSRAARIDAEAKKSYTLAALSETAETSNSADTIISLLAPLDNQDRRTKVKGQLMKHRDGEKANSIELMVDYATSRFSAEFQQRSGVDAVFDPMSVLV